MQSELISVNGGKRQAYRQIGSIARIDMTPLVDLGFLLITFFVFTTSLSDPSSLNLIVPKDKDVVDSTEMPESLALTLLLDGNNKIYYYHGNWGKAKLSGAVFETGFSVYSGIGKVIREKQKKIAEEKRFPDEKNNLMLIIKPTREATYKNVVDAMDEVLINDVRKYALVNITGEENEWIKNIQIRD